MVTSKLTKPREVLSAAALSGALAVIFGAFGAHALRNHLDPSYLRVFQTAVQYHFYHTIALAMVALAIQVYGPSRWLNLSAGCFIAGLLIFCGSLYLLAVSGLSWLGLLTPIGGLSFIAAWCFMGVAAFKNRSST